MKGEVLSDMALQMSDRDNVVTALCDLNADDNLAVAGERDDRVGGTVALAESVPFGHKVALAAIAPGEEVYKYGEVIGRATTDVEPGEWVHTHNVESTRGRGDLAGEDRANGGESG